MNPPPVPALRLFHRLPTCVATGLLMGQVVLGISAQQQGSAMGLLCALVFVISGSAAVALFLKHLHFEHRPRSEPAPVQAWLVMLALGILGSFWLDRLLVG